MKLSNLVEVNLVVWFFHLMGLITKLIPLLQFLSLALAILVSVITIYKFIKNGFK